MPRPTPPRFLPLACVVALAACHHPSTVADGPDAAISDDGGVADVDLASSVVTSIQVSPNPASIDVTVQDGTTTAAPLGFTAVDQDGHAVPASWTIDRGELGAIAGSGVFTANGRNAGKAMVTATFGAAQASATLEVLVHAVNVGANGASGTGPQAPDPAPAGGYNGVGGTSLGAAPPPATIALLDASTGADPAFKLLYPYEGTVWPRGMLAPLLQWSVPSGYHASAVWVHLTQGSYEFKGYYAGTDLVNAPIDAAAWKLATNNNAGDPLVVEVKVTNGTTVLGPLKQTWSVAGSRLRGTVYYNTYNSKLNPGMSNGSDGNGGVLKINPGGFAPQMAIPSLTGTCHVCHEVSSDGSTLFVATSISSDIGQVYSLTDTAATPLNYANGTFTYGGVYPDGSMSLLSSQEDYHAYGGSSDLFKKSPIAAAGSTGFTGAVTRAVTPAFSPDGRRVAFNFWTGGGAGGVTAGAGRSIAAMDFACGAATSSVTCDASTRAFSGLRELYKDPTAGHYVGWPSFTPDSKAVVFQRTTTASGDGGSVLNTRSGAQAELWMADVPDAGGTPRFAPQALCRANGLDEACTTSYLPTNATHAGDQHLNFEPNVTPIASGGYYWVVFTTRRLYGNVATTDPYFPVQNGPAATTPPTKKLWVAAIDPSPQAGKDPSHPAFYLPGQEIMSGNMRGFWVREACHANEASCETGDECCSGYCNDSNGSLTCGDKPAGCIPEYGKCTIDADCCGAGQLTCVGGLCTQPGAQIL